MSDTRDIVVTVEDGSGGTYSVPATVDALASDDDILDLVSATFRRHLQQAWAEHLERAEHELLYGTSDEIPVGLIHD